MTILSAGALDAADTDQLVALRDAVADELARRTGQPAAKVRVAVDFGAYNARRYGKPWIGRIIAWPVGDKPTITWGAYIGRHAYTGAPNGGEVEIMAYPGDIVRWGQKDHRGHDTEAHWGVVNIDQTIAELTAAEARQRYVDKPKEEDE